MVEGAEWYEEGGVGRDLLLPRLRCLRDLSVMAVVVVEEAITTMFLLLVEREGQEGVGILPRREAMVSSTLLAERRR